MPRRSAASSIISEGLAEVNEERLAQLRTETERFLAKVAEERGRDGKDVKSKIKTSRRESSNLLCYITSSDPSRQENVPTRPIITYDGKKLSTVSYALTTPGGGNISSRSSGSSVMYIPTSIATESDAAKRVLPNVAAATAK